MQHLSKTQFHEQLDLLIAETPQEHMDEIQKEHRDKIQKIFDKYISYISKKDAEIYFPPIILKLQKLRLDSSVIKTIEMLCDKFIRGSTIDNLPKEILSSFFISTEIREKQALSLVSKSFQKIAQDSVYLASLLESEDSIEIPEEKKLKIAKKAGNSLKTLRLTYNAITDLELQDVLKACPHLRTLNLSMSYYLTDVAIKDLPSNLQTLDLSYCKWVTSAAIKRLPKNLQTLSLSYCHHLTNEDIKHLPPNLQTLDLVECLYLTNDAIKYLPRNLQTLDLSICRNLTDEAIEYLPPNLQELNVALCYQLTDKAIEIIDKKFPTLQKLNVGGCDNLTEEARTLIKKRKRE